MNKIDRLKLAYTKHMNVPWRSDASAEERVIFCVYGENEELILRAKIDEFALETKNAGHNWLLFDFSDTFAEWLVSQKYGEKYFKKPELIKSPIENYAKELSVKFEALLHSRSADTNTVVALVGVGALFGFLKVRDVISTFAPLVVGRLVVFFPGNYENNNYRLLDAYDGWNYLAVPITADTDM